jgi:hypothetical protein
MFKIGANKLTNKKLDTLKQWLDFIRMAVKIPAVWAGLALNTFAILVWILVLALVDLSLAIPLDSVQAVCSMPFFNASSNNSTARSISFSVI